MTDDAAVTPLVVDVKARWDDADRNGHVNNAAYLALIRAAHDAAAQSVPEGTLPPELLRGEPPGIAAAT
jgi:acyl-CoA thioesterase FadM